MLYHGTYELYKALRVAQGSSANQCKPLRLPTSPMHIDFLEEMSKGGEFDACDLAQRLGHDGAMVVRADEVRARVLLDLFSVKYEVK